MARGNRYTDAALLAASALVLLALAGCGSATTTTSSAADNTVTASGAGTAQAVPDTAEMSFGVTTISPNAKSALDDASRGAEQIASAVKKQGVADEDIQTQNVSLYPQTIDQDGKQVITGYRASLSVRVKVRDISKLGDVISAANAAGANDINGPTFTIDDPAPIRAKAIDEAVADARKSAEAMAKAAGKSVGAVLSMSSSDVGSIPGLPAASGMAGGAKSVPIEPGQLDITANVVVVFELKYLTSLRTSSWFSSSSSREPAFRVPCSRAAECAPAWAKNEMAGQPSSGASIRHRRDAAASLSASHAHSTRRCRSHPPGRRREPRTRPARRSWR